MGFIIENGNLFIRIHQHSQITFAVGIRLIELLMFPKITPLSRIPCGLEPGCITCRPSSLVKCSVPDGKKAKSRNTFESRNHLQDDPEQWY